VAGEQDSVSLRHRRRELAQDAGNLDRAGVVLAKDDKSRRRVRRKKDWLQGAPRPASAGFRPASAGFRPASAGFFLPAWRYEAVDNLFITMWLNVKI